MDFTEAISSGFRKYAQFTGRSRRSEYWYWTLFLILGSIIFSIIDAFITGFIFGTIFFLATLLPGYAVSIRRLHDIDRSGWWVSIGLVLIIGWIILFIWYVKEGTRGENRFGAEPI